MKNLLSFIFGTIFSFGLIVSGMINPNKVIGFLDISRNWDPSLMFVMGGAVVFNFFSFKYILKRKAIMATGFNLPQKMSVDGKLILGSTLFGVGWGLIGICPGPAIVNLVKFDLRVVVFLIAMIVGTTLSKLMSKK